MEQNNFYGQDFNNGTQDGNANNNFDVYPPQFEQNYQDEKKSDPVVEECANGAFTKALASVIMANFPITSIVSIIMGVLALKGVKKTDELAATYGVEAGGKRTAAKIMGLIGTIYSSVMTAFYALYFGIYGIYACTMLVAVMSEM